MSEFRPEIMNDVKRLERIIDPYLGSPVGDNLPQAASRDDVLVDVLHNVTGKPIEKIDVEIHHQIDPSYQ